ncbi:MAG: hypothetical protein JJE22_18450, partial [Bacteroidia bacterium]|nr:hypothetical protein [Bacteroidia bacterium]
MQKKVLAIFFSQSGQLKDIIDCFCEPMIEAGISVEKVEVKMQNEYPFPWTTKSFFSVMPDCVLGVTAELAPFSLKESSYDLIILGYQAWFLSPSIPFSSLIKQPIVRQVLKNTPVITITGARNMWVNAFEKIKKIVGETGAKLVGNIALTDKHLNLLSIFTIFHWMLSGKKDRYLHVFPKPGVSDEDIANTKIFGTIVLPYLQKNEWDGMYNVLISKKAVDLKYHLIFIESKAGVMFKLWANFIAKKKKKTVWL